MSENKQRAMAEREKQSAFDKEEKRLFFNSYYHDKHGNSIKRKTGKLVPKPIPPTEFHVTAIGLAKRESGKYKSRWAKIAYERRIANERLN